MKERIVKRERCYGMDGITFRDKDGILDTFFPVISDKGFGVVSVTVLHKISDLKNMGYKITFDF